MMVVFMSRCFSSYHLRSAWLSKAAARDNVCWIVAMSLLFGWSDCLRSCHMATFLMPRRFSSYRLRRAWPFEDKAIGSNRPIVATSLLVAWFGC